VRGYPATGQRRVLGGSEDAPGEVTRGTINAPTWVSVVTAWSPSNLASQGAGTQQRKTPRDHSPESRTQGREAGQPGSRRSSRGVFRSVYTKSWVAATLVEKSGRLYITSTWGAPATAAKIRRFLAHGNAPCHGQGRRAPITTPTIG